MKNKKKIKKNKLRNKKTELETLWIIIFGNCVQKDINKMNVIGKMYPNLSAAELSTIILKGKRKYSIRYHNNDNILKIKKSNIFILASL